MNPRRENQIARMLLGGVLLVLLGCALLFISIFASVGFRGSWTLVLVALGPILIVGGIVIAGMGVFLGHASNRSAIKGNVTSIPNCYVVGRYQVSGNGDLQFGDFDFEDERAKYFVRLKRPDGSDEEYQCAPELVESIGEGMIGNVQVKGRWLGSFTAVPRV